MLRSLLLLGASALVFAQDASDTTTITSTDSAAPSSTDSSSTSSAPVTHTIGVAKGGHTFEPEVTLAEVGDVIEFQFYPTNHSVIRAEYEYPCIPYEKTGVSKFGFFSGFKPVDAILAEPPAWQITVNDSLPIFYYCGAPGSCINYQMVGVINPNATTSLVTQKQLAKDSTFMLLPGEPWPAEDENPFSESKSTTPTPTPTPTGSNAPIATTSDEPSSSHHSNLSAGAIAGIAIAAAAVALGAAVALFLCGCNSRQQRASMMHHQQDMPFIPPSVSGSHPGHMSHFSMPSMNMNKHMSTHSSVYSPALPGYVQSSHDQNATSSPPLHASYAQSDALNPGSVTGPGSVTEGASPAHSPGMGAAVPAYSMPGPQSRMSYQSNPSIFGAPGAITALGAQLHEMAAPLPTGVHQTQSPHRPASPEIQGAGIMGFIRNSSVSKAGVVERYS